jgi:hypothetical protein
MRQHESHRLCRWIPSNRELANAVESAEESPGGAGGFHRTPYFFSFPTMIDALWPPKPKLLLITWPMGRSCGVFGV